MSIFDKTLICAANERWAVGRKERGMLATDPFQGDPVEELGQEIADAWNYLTEVEKKLLQTDYYPHGVRTLVDIEEGLAAIWEQMTVISKLA
jgi:hypothetical protein